MVEYNTELMCEISIDVDAIEARIAEHAPIFEDAYGDGVALVNAVSYATYHELAGAFNLDIFDFGDIV